MPGGGHKAEAETLEIVKGILECVELELATVARARVDEAESETAAEASLRAFLQSASEFLNERLGHGRRGLGETRAD